MKKQKLIEAAGWLGVGLILIAYVLNNFGSLGVGSVLYNLLNILGAAGIIVDGLSKRDLQPVVLNIIWLTVAVVALIR